MKTVNLRDFYQSIYDHDCLYEVPDEVAELLILYKRREEAHRRLTYEYRAFFSLDCCDGIENEAVHNSPSAEEIFFRYADNVELCAALQRLTDKQLRRLYARYFLNMKYTDIAKRENVNESTIRCSIQSALSRLEKSIKKRNKI